MSFQHIRLTRYDPGALGRIILERDDHGPLFTVRLDVARWPGAANKPDDHSGDLRFVDLREHEFDRITAAEHRRLTALPPPGHALTLRERNAANARAYRDRRRAAS